MSNFATFNLLWIAMAMTVPENTQERFYYDAVTKQFFYSRPLPDAPHRIELFDTIDLHLFDNDYDDIMVRLEWVNDESSQIVEIPRLNIEDKIAIQLLFLSNFHGVLFLQELISAVENQKDDYQMVLDTVLIENDSTAPMAPYWDNSKLQTITTYINNFANAVGIDLIIA
jgi:hypothetical protein